MTTQTTFLQDMWIYAARIREFKRDDWFVYIVWLGLMLGLFWTITVFLLTGYNGGVDLPGYVWNLPLGAGIFVIAIGFDTIGHRTIYKAALKQGEQLIHHITIAAGITSCVFLCLAFTYREFFMIPSVVMTGLAIMYSAIDEAMHWIRYFQGNSDRIEMWSHFFIFVGHNILMMSWVYWFLMGYPGVAQTLELLN